MALVTCLVLAALVWITPPAEQSEVSVGDMGERIAAFVHKAEAVGFSGAVLAAKDGKVVAAAGVGFADLAETSPNTPATLFEIASASKQFTATAVLRLSQDGKLTLDDPISKHLPGVPENCSAITIRHLLQHTTGIPGTNSRGGGDELQKVLPMFLAGGPRHPPGKRFEYWNQGYSLVSEVIARASGMSYTAYCSEFLFKPAGMTLTRFTGDAAPPEEAANVAVGRSAFGKPRSALEHPYGAYGFQYRGMGGVVTNVWDLWRWDRSLLKRGEGAVVSDASYQMLLQPGLGDYALGWIVKKDVRGKTIQSHGGAVRGFVCEVRRLPDDDGCVFVLANGDDAPARQVADGVQAILLGEPYKPVTIPDPLPAELRATLAGSYKDSKGNILEIRTDGRTARARIVWAANAAWRTVAIVGLNADKSPVWFSWEETTVLTPHKGDDGVVTSIVMGPQTFVRIEQDQQKR